MSKKNVYLASIIGEVLEWYDFSLYSFLSPILVVLFFPKEHPVAGLLGVFAIFAAGFISRPIGGLLFGWLADRRGRKAAFFASLALMAIPTFLMGCLPTFESVGFLAPACLLILRLLQGLSCGGEFSISMIFLSEHASKENYFFSGSLAWMGNMIGALVASVVIMAISFHHEFLMHFGWRLPFFLGGIIAVAGIYLRLKTAETPVFIELNKKNQIKKDRWYFVKKHKKVMLKIFLLNAPLAALSYVGVAYFPTYLSKFVGMPLDWSFLIITLLIVGLIILIPICGCLADKVGGWRIYRWAIVSLVLFSFPVYGLLSVGHSWFAYGLAIVLFIISGALIKSVTPGISVQLAPLEDRAVVMSFSYNVTYCLIGGTAPLLMSYLITQTHFLLFPAVYIVFFALLTLFSRKLGN
ncbi:MAG: MFS transporter [Gammaproteobacteria bacterium]|nr:MFS transporter [Gammaproteobacteria bacterium]